MLHSEATKHHTLKEVSAGTFSKVQRMFCVVKLHHWLPSRITKRSGILDWPNSLSLAKYTELRTY